MTEQNFTTEELNAESWKPVIGFETLYEISNLGRVKRTAAARATQSGRILKPIPNDKGYCRVNLYFGQKRKIVKYIHRLVANAFIGDIPKDFEINHKDTN